MKSEQCSFQFFPLVNGRHLGADARPALGHHGEEESRDVDAALVEFRRHVLRQPRLAQHDGDDRVLARQQPDVPIVFISATADVPRAVEAVKHGAVDFLTKPVDDKALLNSLRQAFQQEAANRSFNVELSMIRDRLMSLTPREREVLGYVVGGRLNKQIAATLGTTEKTVKVHRARIMEKMGARSLPQLIEQLAQVGWLKLADGRREDVEHRHDGVDPERGPP